MAATTHTEPNYMAIFWWLLALTVAEVAVTYTGLPKMVMGFLLIAMALSKAALVAMFFMHLKFERVTLGMIAVTPLVICVFLLFMLLPDSNPFLKPPPQAAATGSSAVAD
ncbi:MAG: cytochrome C oxidase subunit IV family protein [Candidatus Binatia bacterium]